MKFIRPVNDGRCEAVKFEMYHDYRCSHKSKRTVNRRYLCGWCATRYEKILQRRAEKGETK